MKKIFLIVSVFFIIFFLFPANASADCAVKKQGKGSAPCSNITCAVNGTPYCCDTQQECNDLKSQTPAPPTDIKCGANKDGINTAIGCITVLDTPEAFLADILKWAVGIGGGIAFLLILYAGFMIMTASGNPERLKAGQELLTSAISGLILLVLSIFILKFIGIDILGLDQFGFGVTP